MGTSLDHFNGPEARAYYTYFRDHHNWHFRSAHFTELINAIESIIRYNEEPTDDTDLLTAQQIIHILTLICTESNEKMNCSQINLKQFCTIWTNIIPKISP